MIKTGVGKLIH